MPEQIDNFRLKLRNTRKLKRQSLAFSTTEAEALDVEITELEKHIEKLETELLQNKTLTIDIIGQNF